MTTATPHAQDARLHRLAEPARFAGARADPRERERLIAAHLPLARAMAQRYLGSDEPFEDLLQVACVGLVEAVDRFDPAHGFAFSSFATPTILGELRRHFRDRAWSVRPPRGLQELSLRIDRTTDPLTAELGRPPSVGDLADALEVGEHHILEALAVASAYRAAPLPADDDDDENGRADVPAAVDDGYARAEQRALLAPLLRTLTEAERRIIHLRFHDDLTQTEIAARVRGSQVQVSRVLRRGVGRLQDAAADAA